MRTRRESVKNGQLVISRHSLRTARLKLKLIPTIPTGLLVAAMTASSISVTEEVAIVIEVAITFTESTVAEKVVVVEPANPVTSFVSENEVIIVETAVAVTDSVTHENVANASPARSATIPAPVSGVVAVYKLAALIVRVAENSATPMAAPAALAQRRVGDNHRQQQRDQDDRKEVVPVPRILHKTPPSILALLPWFPLFCSSKLIGESIT